MTSPSIRPSQATPLAIMVIALFAVLALLVTWASEWMLGLAAHKATAVQAKTLQRPAGAFELENSGTKANLRGIHSAGGGVAWASGSDGTVLRTEDSGFVWQSCAMPPGAEKLDFRAVWAWDANVAVVMSSGPGGRSRLYKTIDGCSHWKLLYTNPDPSGFWDAMIFDAPQIGKILGDPVDGRFPLIYTEDDGSHWHKGRTPAPQAALGEAAFAASNSSWAEVPGYFQSVEHASDASEFFGTGGKGGPHIFRSTVRFHLVKGPKGSKRSWTFDDEWVALPIPLASGTDSAGVFSLAFRDQQHGMAVGGDYQKPSESTGTAAWTADGGKTWTAAAKPPHGYRSSVAWDEQDKSWITVGTNGADVSWDDGRTWTSIDDGNWNAISLPWVVGPAGRVAKLISLNLRDVGATGTSRDKTV